MRARSLLPLFILVLLGACTAQQESDPHRVELFGGYSYLRYPIPRSHAGPWFYQSFNGWDVSATAGISKHFGVEGDFAGGSGSSVGDSFKTYMGGPRYSTNFGKVGVFGHALFGAMNFSSPGCNGCSATSFALAFGGGANFWVTRHWGVRIAQLDYVRNTNTADQAGGYPFNQPSADLRFSTGLTVRF